MGNVLAAMILTVVMMLGAVFIWTVSLSAPERVERVDRSGRH
jgi:hypothetical protein